MAISTHAIDWLLAPITLESFVPDFWDRAPMHVQGRDPDYYSELYSIEDFDVALNHNGISAPWLRLVKDGREADIAEYRSSRANLIEEVFAQHRDGASIVLQLLHEQNAQLKNFAASLSLALSTHVQVNAYMTPAGERGLGRHYDSHDVFVLQIYGRKHWVLYDRVEPIPYKKERGSRSEVQDAQPTQSLTLSPGDCLYLPRGWIHEAGSRDCSSLHLTIGVHPITYGQVLLGAVTDILQRDGNFRSSLPPGFTTRMCQRQAAQEHLNELRSLLSQAMESRDLLRLATSAALQSVPPRLGGHLLDLTRLEQINLNTRLRVRSIDALEIEESDLTIRLRFHGKVLECPAALAESLRFMIAKGTFAVGELPDMLAAEDKVLLARRLVKEGLLTIEVADARQA